MPCKPVWILSITSLLLHESWSQGYTTSTSLLATQLFDPRIYGIRPQYYSYNDIEPPEPTKQGPVTFPNDTPPPPRTPLIVTAKPLAESIAKSDLNPTPPTITSNTTKIRAEETEQNNQIFKPTYFAKVRNYHPYNLPYNPHFNPGINPGFNPGLHQDYNPGDNPGLNPSFYSGQNDYNLVDSYGHHYDSYGRNIDNYGNNIDKYGNSIDSFGNGIAADYNLGLPVGRKAGFDGNSNSNENQRLRLPPIFNVIGEHAKQRLEDLKRKQIFKKKQEEKLIHHDKNKYENNEIDDSSDLSRNSDYAFSYSVHDKKSGDDFSHSQKSSGTATNGEYRVKLPDGRVQIVSYIADENGYHADVRYDGEDHHHNRKDYKVTPEGPHDERRTPQHFAPNHDNEILTGRKIQYPSTLDHRTPEIYNSIAGNKAFDYNSISDYKQPDYYHQYDYRNNDINNNINYLNDKLNIENDVYIKQREHENKVQDLEFNSKILNDKLKYDNNNDVKNEFKQNKNEYKINEDYYPDVSKESGNDDNINDYSDYEYDDYQHRSKFSNLAKQKIGDDKFGVIIVPNINDVADNTNNIIATVRPSLQNLRKLFLNRIAASSVPKASIPVEINVPSTTPRYKTPDSSEHVVLIGGKRNLYTNSQQNIQQYTNRQPNIPQYTDRQQNVQQYTERQPNIPQYTDRQPYTERQPNVPQYTTSRPYTTPQSYLEATVAALRAQNSDFSEQKPKSSNTFINRINKYLTFK